MVKGLKVAKLFLLESEQQQKKNEELMLYKCRQYLYLVILKLVVPTITARCGDDLNFTIILNKSACLLLSLYIWSSIYGYSIAQFFCIIF